MIFFDSRAVYEIMWKNNVGGGRSQMTICNTTYPWNMVCFRYIIVNTLH